MNRRRAAGSIPRPRVFYGWWVVLASALALLLGPVPILVLSFGVFLKPLAKDLHSGRAAISFALTLHNIGLASGLVWAGRLVDRFGARKVILPSMIASGLVLLLSCRGVASVWQLYVFFLLAGLAGAGMTPVSFACVITRWFDRRRGLALGLMLLGMGAGATLVPSVAQWLIESVGWRSAYAAAGAAMLTIAWPLAGAILRDGPEQMGILPDAAGVRPSLPAGAVDEGCTLREALHTRAFWLLLIAVVVVSASLHACFGHLPAILTDRGSSAKAAAAASSLFGLGTLLGRVATGYLLDRFFAPRIGAWIFGIAAGGIALLGLTGSQAPAYAAALAMGFGWGTEGDLKAYLVSRYFGLRSFASIFGLVFSAFVLAGGLGGYLMGRVFDSAHSYDRGLSAAFFGLLLSAGLMLLLRPYVFRVERAPELAPVAAAPPWQAGVRPLGRG